MKKELTSHRAVGGNDRANAAFGELVTIINRHRITPQGVPKVSGDGTAKVIASGDILDKDGNNIGDLHETALEAVEAWENVLGDFGVKL